MDPLYLSAGIPSCMSMDEPSKEDIHITIFEYQEAYLEEQGYNKSRVIRDALDDRMIQDGAHPEQWEQTYRDG